MKKLTISLFLISLTYAAFSQRKCGVEEICQPNLQKRHQDLQRYLEINQAKIRQARIAYDVIRIPVVVHIIHNSIDGKIGGEGNSNISDEQVYSQIKVLNNDYRKKIGTLGYNTNSVGADMGIEFYLASTDPNGLPTTGITRTYSPQTEFNVFSDIPKLSALSYWDSNRYLNVWVTAISDNYIGYGEFPTGEFDGLELQETDERTDGVVIDYQVFGDKVGTASTGIYSFGRTLTHEVGHWFGLIHTWGDAFCGDDYCADTPPTESANSSSKCRIKYSYCDGIKTQNMIENYMDYSPDSCMNIFTINQQERVRDIIAISKRRSRIVKYAKELIPFTATPDLVLLSNPGTINELKFKILLPDFQDFTLTFYSSIGQVVQQKQYADYPSTIIESKGLIEVAGNYFIQLSTKNTVITKRFILY